MAATTDIDIVIIGAGVAGLRALHTFRGMGLNVAVLEASDEIGGVWNFNRYPGARCDVESFDYSYRFSPELEQDWRWSERYATQPEILRYINHVADRFDLRRDVQLNTRVTSALFDRKDPFNPVNRRIDIIVLTKKAQRAIEGEQDSGGDAVPTEATAPGQAPPAADEPAQPEELRQRLNIFEDGALQFDQPQE